MEHLISRVALAIVLSSSLPVELLAARVVVKRSAIVVRPGHPIRRAYSRTVVVRPSPRVVITRSPIVYLPPVMWTARATSLPPRDRLVWEQSETIRRSEDWVDMSFGVDSRGDALLVFVDGEARIDFAEVTFENGQVQVIDFNERVQATGTFRLLDFADGRRVDSVRILAKAESLQARFSVYMRK